MASTSLWSPIDSAGHVLSPHDKHYLSNGPASIRKMPRPLLASSPVSNHATNSLLNNSLDLADEIPYTPYHSNVDSGIFNSSNLSRQSSKISTPINSHLVSRSESISSKSPTCAEMKSNIIISLAQSLQYRTERWVSGLRATPWNNHVIVEQLQKLEDANLIDRELIKQDNPPLDVLTLVQKLVKYNMVLELIESEDEQLRVEQLSNLFKLRGEVLSLSSSIQEITEKREANRIERNRIKVVMHDFSLEIANKSKDFLGKTETTTNKSA